MVTCLRVPSETTGGGWCEVSVQQPVCHAMKKQRGLKKEDVGSACEVHQCTRFLPYFLYLFLTDLSSFPQLTLALSNFLFILINSVSQKMRLLHLFNSHLSLHIFYLSRFNYETGTQKNMKRKRLKQRVIISGHMHTSKKETLYVRDLYDVKQ